MTLYMTLTVHMLYTIFMVLLYMVTIVTSGVAVAGCDGMCDNIVSQQSTNVYTHHLERALEPTMQMYIRWNADLTIVHGKNSSQASRMLVSIPHQIARMTPN